MKPVLLACGMRRGGSTLQFQILGDILQAAGIGCESRYVNVLDAKDLEPDPEGVFRVIKTHAVPKDPQIDFRADRIQCFHVFRDPRDALVSYLAKYESKYTNERASRFMQKLHSEFAYWRSRECVYSVRYEDMVQDLSGEIDRCARAMGIGLAPDVIDRIATLRSLESQKRRIEEFDWKSSLAIHNGQDVIDPETQLHSNHIRNGGIGNWHHELDGAAVEFIESRFGECIQQMGYALTTRRWRRWRRRFIDHLAKPRS